MWTSSSASIRPTLSCAFSTFLYLLPFQWIPPFLPSWQLLRWRLTLCFRWEGRKKNGKSSVMTIKWNGNSLLSTCPGLPVDWTGTHLNERNTLAQEGDQKDSPAAVLTNRAAVSGLWTAALLTLSDQHHGQRNLSLLLFQVNYILSVSQALMM